MYLYEEGEQIVIHRDIKTSNVLIDEDMNPRLGDFGLALIYERGVSPTKCINFKLPVWIMAFYSSGEILNSVDHTLEACYDSEQARAALVVGLLCCHQTPHCRPSIATVISYLNEEESIPNIDDTWGVSTSSTTLSAPLSLSGTQTG
ncbi:hypothetical protein HID58_086347 [Brassica napus]|uniref:Protein kinase domain-containing protein n=2 Tax=Brassica TaxID=3705 RepID=A0ABQ7XSQ4_BRANA|nr:hypothetical protein HID58_086347 [Brassica napus]